SVRTLTCACAYAPRRRPTFASQRMWTTSRASTMGTTSKLLTAVEGYGGARDVDEDEIPPSVAHGGEVRAQSAGTAGHAVRCGSLLAGVAGDHGAPHRPAAPDAGRERTERRDVLAGLRARHT